MHPQVGERWSAESLRLVNQLVRLRTQRAPAALRPAATQRGLQSTLAATLLESYVAGALPGAQLLPLEDLLPSGLWVQGYKVYRVQGLWVRTGSDVAQLYSGLWV